MSKRRLSALIVDDEPLARKGLRKLLSEDGRMTVAGECADGLEAVAKIEELRPDVVFLDIQMPGLDGFGVIEAIGIPDMPVTIFVTAYNLHAMRAFDVHAVDYLLKPVTSERLSVAVDRAGAIASGGDRGGMDARISVLLDAIKPADEKLRRFIIRSVGKVAVIPVDEVEWIEADGDYVKLHTPQKTHLLREKMSILEQKLDPSDFIRIHRSTIVRIRHIRELRPLMNGDHVVILRNGEKLSLSRSLREKVFAALQSGI